MIKNVKVSLLFMICAMGNLLLLGCSFGNTYDKEIPKLIEIKNLAIQNKDIETYMSTIDPHNKEFYNEQMRWINKVTKNDIENYSLELVKIEPIDDTSVVVTLNQKYKYNNKNYELFTYSKAPINNKYKNVSAEEIVSDYLNVNIYTSL